MPPTHLHPFRVRPPCVPRHLAALRAACVQGNGELLFNGGGGVHSMQDKGYAFVEFRSVEEASNAMALDGVKLRDAYLKVCALSAPRMERCA